MKINHFFDNVFKFYGGFGGLQELEFRGRAGSNLLSYHMGKRKNA